MGFSSSRRELVVFIEQEQKVWIMTSCAATVLAISSTEFAFSKLRNIAVVSGDAFRLLNERFLRIHCINLINFPEPPHQYHPRRKSRNDKALLNKDFFVAAHKALKEKEKNI